MLFITYHSHLLILHDILIRNNVNHLNFLFLSLPRHLQARFQTMKTIGLDHRIPTAHIADLH